MLRNGDYMKINAIIPENFEKELNDYLTNASLKDELDRRNYFVNKVLVNWFKINPDYIDFETKRRDLYFSGILFETKILLNDANRKDAFEELNRYIKVIPNPVIKVVVTDMIKFEVYEPETIRNYNEKDYSKTVKDVKEVYELNKGTPEEIFERIFKLLYARQLSLPISTKIIVPRLLNLINRLSLQIEEIKSDNIKFITWANFLSVALGSKKEANIDLFKKYVILYYISTLSVAKVLDIKTNRNDIINGNAFLAKGILNFTSDEDFFNVLDSKDKVIEDIEEELNQYDFKQATTNTEQDFFRLLYEELILPSDRHSLGEFYTPDWLAQYLVDELVDKDNRVLDPSCGSGTFLKLAIKKKRELGSKNIETQIIGFDINPISVIVAKANIILELKKAVPIIPVFVADSLMTELKIKQKQLTAEYVNINFEDVVKGYGIEGFYYKPEGKDLDPKEMYDYIKKMAKAARNEREINGNLLPNQKLIEKISDLISKNKNHIWFFILQNIYNPYYYLGKIDAVIGNPPWLTYKDVESPSRQRFLDALYMDYGLGSGSENKGNQDMSAFFIARTQEYLKDKVTGKIGFVLTRAIFDSAQYNAIRRAVSSANSETANLANDLPKISKIYDFDVKLNPFRRTSCIIIFDFKNTSNEIEGIMLNTTIKAKVNENPEITASKKKFYINITKNESGIGILKLKSNTSDISYKEEFKRGASIIPRPYYFVDINREDKYGFEVSCSTEYKNASGKRKRKRDWHNFPDNTIVEKHLVYDVITGDMIDKYKYSTKKVVLPILNGSLIFKEVKEANHYSIKLVDNIEAEIYKLIKNEKKKSEDEEIMKQLLQNLSKVYQEFEDNWEMLRGSKFNLKPKSKQSQKMGILSWLDYQNKLTSQTDTSKYTVVYNKSGHDVRCCVVKGITGIIDDECYYYKTNNKIEAYYLEGVLNSNFLLKIFVESGLKSERDIHKKIFELGIPRFEGSNKKHIEIAECAENQEKGKNEDDLNRIEELVAEIM